MPLQIAENPQGDRVVLVDNEWVPVTQRAVNATGTEAYLVGNQWLVNEPVAPTPTLAAASPKPVAPIARTPLPKRFDEPLFGLPSIMGGAPEAPPAPPLLERKPETPPPALPTTSFAPVTPEIRKAAQAAWNLATPEQREAMQNQSGWRGQLAREQAGLIEGINPEATTSTMAKFDPRVEARKQQLLLKGEDPRFAETAAREATMAGVAPGKEIEYLQNTQGLADKIKPTQFAPGEEFEKGALGAVNVGLPSLWEQAKVSADAAVATTIQDRLNLFDKIDSGEIVSPIDPQLRGMGVAPGQGRAYLDAPPENRQGMRNRLQGELGKRKDFIDASIKTLQAYQQESLKYKGRTEDFTDVRTVTDFSNWLAKQGGAGLVQLAPIMVAAVATGGAGVFAMSAAMGVSEATSNRLKAIEKKLAQLPENQRAQEVINYLQSSRDVNLAVGVFSGALDVVLGPAARMAKLFAGKMAKDATRMEALKAGLKEVPKQVGEEAVTGGAQEAAQIAGEVQLKEQEKFLTDANIKRLINSSAAEAAGALGASGPTVASRVARTHGILSQEEAATTAADRAAAAPAPAPVAPTVAAAPAAPAPAPVAPPTPSAPGVIPPDQAARLAELTQQYIAAGIEETNAGLMALAVVRKEAETAAEQVAPPAVAPAPPAPPAAPLTPVQTRAAEIEDELVNAGVAPDQAKIDALAKAQQEEADDAAAAKAEEEKNVVAESVEPPSEAATPGPESTEVVSTEPDVGKPPAEEQQPPPVTTRTLADVSAEIDAGMEEVKQLTQQQQVLLTKAGRKPAAKSPAFAKWDALGAQIDAKKDAVGRLFIEEDKLKKEGQVTASTTAPGAPILIDSVSSAGDLETEASKYVGRGVPITLKDGSKAELIIFEEAPPLGVSSAIVAIDSKGNPLGTLQFEFDPEGKSQPDVGVRPEALRKGVATAMYDYAEQLGAKFPAENPVRTEEGVAFHAARKKAKLAKEAPSGTEAVETKQAEPQAQETATPEFFDSLGIPPQALVRTKHAGAELTSPDLRAALVRLTQNKSIKDVPKTLAAIGKFLSSTKNSVTKPLESIAPATTPRAPKVATPRVHVRQNLAALNERLRSGKITLEQHAEAVENIVARMEAAARIRQGSRRAGRERGPDIVREKLLAARRRKELDADTVEFALWLLNKYPHVAEDLAISVKAGTDAGTLGHYVEASRLIALFKGYSNPITAVHEILHHTERMMPEAVQLGIRKLWAEKYSATLKAATDPKQVEALEAILLAMAGDEPSRKLVREAFDAGVLKIDPHYQLTNPSEYWAVNATNILANRYAANSWIAKAKQWLMELLEKVKGLLGLQSNAPVLKGLKDILAGNGEFLSKRVLAEISGAILPSIAPPPTPSAPPTPTPAAPGTSPPVQISATRLARKLAIAKRNFEISNSGTEAAEAANLLYSLRDGSKFVQFVASSKKAMSNKALSTALFLVPGDVVASWGSSWIGNENLNKTNDLIGDMRGMQHGLLKAAGMVSESMVRAIKADPALRAKLEKAIYVSTTARVDPSIEKRDPYLNKVYADLGPEGQRIYNEVKTYYASMVDYYSYLLDEQINAANLPGGAQKLIMAEIKKLYEVDKRIVPYFPLVRNRGDFWLRIGQGKKKEFYTFGTVAERDAVMREAAKRMGISVDDMLKDKKIADAGDDLTSYRIDASDSSRMLKDTFAKIDSIKNTGSQTPAQFTKTMEDLKDSIYDLFLTTMPDQSFRKSFIERKDTIGYNVDIVRNFSTSAMHMASQLSRIAYSTPLRNSLLAAQKSLEGNPDKPKYERFVQEMSRRVRLELHPFENPPTGISKDVQDIGAAVGSFATRLSFLHYLSSASSALIQFTAVPYGMANLGARHGYTETAVELAKLTRLWKEFDIRKKNADGSTSIIMPRMSGLNADEERALRDMGTHGVDITLTNEMLGRGRLSSAAYQAPLQKIGRGVMTVAGGLFHNAERMSREIIYMTSYRLSRKASRAQVQNGTITNDQAHKQAVDQAVADTYDSAGNMAEWNRAPIFRGVPGRVALQFLSYPLFMTMRLTTTFVQMMPLLNNQHKAQAFREFAGILGVTWMLAGAVGLPTFSLILGAVGAILNAMDDKDKPEDLKSLSFIEWFKREWMPQVLGDIELFGKPVSDLALYGPVNFFTGIDMSSRSSLNDLWFKDHITTKTPREGAIQFAIEHAGPSVNLMLSYLDAFKAYGDGDIQKFGEKILPSMVRGPLAAFKYYQEGAKGVKGETLMSSNSFTAGAIAAQAIGFRSSELANLQAWNFKAYTLGQKIINERNNIIRNIGDAYLKEQTPRFKEWIEKRKEFNKKFPIEGVAITDEGINRSLKRINEARLETWKGIALTPQNIMLFMEAAKPTRDAVDWLEKEGKKRKEEAAKP